MFQIKKDDTVKHYRYNIGATPSLTAHRKIQTFSFYDGTLKELYSQATRLIYERVTDTGCESQFILSPWRERWAEMARAVCMEIYRSENDRVERFGKRGFFIGVTYASPRSLPSLPSDNGPNKLSVSI